MSLDRKKLFEITIAGLRSQFHDDLPKYRLFRYLWHQIIFDDPTVNVRVKGSSKNWNRLPSSKSMFRAKPGHGIVIGNLTSQLLSNIYLNQLDRYVTFDLGLKHYGRYVDDFFIVSEDKAVLKSATQTIEKYLSDLDLVLHPRKRAISEVIQGVAFLGAVLYPYRIHPNDRAKQGLHTADYMLCQSDFRDEMDTGTLEKLNATLISYRGHMIHFKHYKLLSRLKSKGEAVEYSRQPRGKPEQR